MSESIHRPTLPQYHQHSANAPGPNSPASGALVNGMHTLEMVRQKAEAEQGFVNVWRHNLDAAFDLLRQFLKQGYTYVAMDTEFPGVVAKPLGDVKDYAYQCLKCNVDLLKLIQVGISLFNEEGENPEIHTWQFNFKFKIDEDMYAQDSIELLKNAGLNFSQHQADGIDILKFGRLMLTSGLVLMPEITWMSFHSGYDFGYLVKILTNTKLPTCESEFFSTLKLFFSSFYDIKLLIGQSGTYKGGLQELAEYHNIERVGSQHQAGSDALLTGKVFFEAQKDFKKDSMDKDKLEMLKSQLFGLTNILNALPTKDDATSFCEKNATVSD